MSEAKAEVRRRLDSLDPPGRRRALFRASFVVFFLAMMLVRGIDEKHRGPLGPLTDWYGNALGLARTWGMFARPGDEQPLFFFAERAGGPRVQVSPNPNATIFENFRDSRLRKFRSHLGRPGVRERLGEHAARYHCTAPEVLRLLQGKPERVTLMRVPRRGSVGEERGSVGEEKVLEVKCP